MDVAATAAGMRSLRPMPRTCAFCDGSSTTREHIWPNWARRRLSAAATPHHVQVQQDDQVGRPRLWAQVPFSMTVKAVCADCNNGWMSDLQAIAKPLLEAMLEERSRGFDEQDQAILARWALKTAMMVDQTQAPQHRVIPPEEYQHLRSVGRPSANVRVWLASYTGEALHGLGRMFGLDADMDAGPDPARGHRDLWGAAITVGAGVLEIFGTELHAVLNRLDLQGVGVWEIWPYEGPVAWSPRPGFDDEQLVAFADAPLHWLNGQAAPEV